MEYHVFETDPDYEGYHSFGANTHIGKFDTPAIAWKATSIAKRLDNEFEAQLAVYDGEHFNIIASAYLNIEYTRTAQVVSGGWLYPDDQRDEVFHTENSYALTKEEYTAIAKDELEKNDAEFVSVEWMNERDSSWDHEPVVKFNYMGDKELQIYNRFSDIRHSSKKNHEKRLRKLIQERLENHRDWIAGGRRFVQATAWG